MDESIEIKVINNKIHKTTTSSHSDIIVPNGEVKSPLAFRWPSTKELNNVDIITIEDPIEIQAIQTASHERTPNHYTANKYDLELVWKNIEISIKEEGKAKHKKVSVIPKAQPQTEAQKQDIKYFKNGSTAGTVELIGKNETIHKNYFASETKIINNVSGRIRSGECLAIIGSSGAGKTTLLNYLSNKIQMNNLIEKGEYKINDHKIEPNCFSLISAYVMQDDILEATMTPLEILMFTAKLKLNLPLPKIEASIRKMISDLHLEKCQNTRVGNHLIRGVSGGERKRTSIGVELISDPKIIFLDEPTTGLDSYNAFEVINLLRHLASEGKIIIFTIHQPSSEIFSLLDKLCILALGKTVYFGDKDKAVDYFDYVRLPLPLRYNPFEHFLETTNASAVFDKRILETYPELQEETDAERRYYNYVTILNKSYEEFREQGKLSDKLDRVDTCPLVNFTDENMEYFKEKKKRKSIWYEFAMLMGRSVVVNFRNSQVLKLKLLQTLVSAVLISILFVRITKNQSGIQDRNGLIFLTVVHNALSSVTHTILVFADTRKVFTRERANRLYRVMSFYLGNFIGEVPVVLLSISIYCILVYFSTELNDTFSWKYWVFRTILINLNSLHMSYGFSLWSQLRILLRLFVGSI